MLRPNNQVKFHDFKPESASFKDSVLAGLAKESKQLSPKFFYDDKGSQLFEAILEQPEYYIPDIEKALLAQYADEFADLINPEAVLIEPGSGSCEKVQLLLEPVAPAAYVPMDISGDFLHQAALDVGQKFPWLDIHAACLDFTQTMIVPEGVPDGQRVVFIPGSSLGNFDPAGVQMLLADIHRLIGVGGGLLVGIDRKKDPAILNAAYNDAAGVTAEFNLNLLTRINNELDGNFDLDLFKHKAFYNDQKSRIEMHLVSQEDHQVDISSCSFQFEKGESIHTENSYKYAPEEFIALACTSGFSHTKLWSDSRHFFSLYFFEAQAHIDQP